MLETDEVDVDLFTPASSTSLAHIFKKSSQVEDGTDKATLKYIPQPPPTNEDVKPEETKPTECIFACATYAYEWSSNTYINKGKLGFALMKILKNSTHNFILYDANKTTLSCATLTSKFEVQVKDNVSISYYDNAQKYWSINAKDSEIHKILEILKELNVNLKYSTEQENGPPKPVPKDTNKNKNTQMSVEDRTSDTDSSINRRTKDSILKRMATMGHSVLPQTQKNIESTDSSDSNENSTLRRTSKHKPLKSYNSNTNKQVLETVDGGAVKESLIMTRPYEGTSNIYENPNEVITCKSLEIVNNRRDDIAGGGMSDVSLLISEQRVSNSELRININRISDKLDLVIDKMKQNSINDKGIGESNYQNIIVQKLLNEYEMKIKKYEEIIQAYDLESKNYRFDAKNNMPNDNLCHNVLEISNDENKEKDQNISQLKDELIKVTKQNENLILKEKTYLDEITNLKKEIDFKDEQLTNLNRKIEDTSSNFQKSDDAKNRIKLIMNDAFQSIATSFTNEESYSGAKVKNIVAAVIKKTTIEAISDL